MFCSAAFKTHQPIISALMLAVPLPPWQWDSAWLAIEITANSRNGNMKKADVFSTVPLRQNLALRGRQTGRFVGSNPWNAGSGWHPGIRICPFPLAQEGSISFCALNNWICFENPPIFGLEAHWRAPERLVSDSDLANRHRDGFECCSLPMHAPDHHILHIISLTTKFHK